MVFDFSVVNNLFTKVFNVNIKFRRKVL